MDLTTLTILEKFYFDNITVESEKFGSNLRMKLNSDEFYKINHGIGNGNHQHNRNHDHCFSKFVYIEETLISKLMLFESYFKLIKYWLGLKFNSRACYRSSCFYSQFPHIYWIQKLLVNLTCFLLAVSLIKFIPFYFYYYEYSS